MSDSFEVDLNVNENSDSGRRNTPADNSPGVSSQDQNFAPLTGGSQLSNRSGLGMGDDVFRPKGFEAAPELLNLLSIASTSSRVLREMFLPLRKIYQLYANQYKKEQDLLKKKEKNEQQNSKKTKEGTRQRKSQEQEFLDKGLQFIKGGQFFPFYEGKSQGRAKKGGEWFDPITRQVQGRDYSRRNANAGEQGPLGFWGKIFKPFTDGTVWNSIKSGANLVFKPISKTSQKVWGGFMGSVMKNFKAISLWTGVITAATAAASYFADKLMGWAQEWVQFSPETIATMASENVKNIEAQQRAANRTDKETAAFTRASGALGREFMEIRSVLVDSIMPIVTALYRIALPFVKIIKAGVAILGLMFKVVGAIFSVVATLVEWIMWPVNWLMDRIQDIYDYMGKIWDWMNNTEGLTELQNIGPMMNMLGVSGGTTEDIMNFKKTAREDWAVMAAGVPGGAGE